MAKKILINNNGLWFSSTMQSHDLCTVFDLINYGNLTWKKSVLYQVFPNSIVPLISNEQITEFVEDRIIWKICELGELSSKKAYNILLANCSLKGVCM